MITGDAFRRRTRLGILVAAALTLGAAVGCSDLEPVGSDAGDAETGTAADTAIDSGGAGDSSGMQGFDTPVVRDSQSSMESGTANDSDPRGDVRRDTESARDTATPPMDTGSPSGPGACCTRSGCVMVDAGMACLAPTYFPGRSCSAVQCGFSDT